MKSTAMKMPQSRMGTSMNPAERPMTSNKAAGYSKTLGKDPKEFDGKLLYYFLQ
jgi:hypothetical protein